MYYKILKLVTDMYQVAESTALRWLNSGSVQEDVNRRIRILKHEIKEKEAMLTTLEKQKKILDNWPTK
jgi:hypothetical protein